nr:copper chaperone PCu(A)C [Corynebacterium lactis]
MKLTRTATALIAGSAALTLVLAGCSSNDQAATATESASSAVTSATKEMKGESVTLADAYIKEKPATKMMTGIFGVLSNSTDKEITITDFKLEGLKEGTVFEQHDTKDGKMFKVDGGLRIPAGGELKLAPGSTHLMVMKNDEAMEPGAEYKLVINFSDGSSLSQTVQVRPQAAGEENYGSDGKLENPEHKGGEMKMDDQKMGMENGNHEGHNH